MDSNKKEIIKKKCLKEFHRRHAGYSLFLIKKFFFNEPGILIFHSVKQQQEEKNNARKETCSFLLNSKKGRHCLIEYFEGSGHLIFAPSAEENSR